MSSAIAKVFSDRQYTCFECAKLRRCPSPRNGMPADGTTPICFEYKPADPARPQDARELAVSLEGLFFDREAYGSEAYEKKILKASQLIAAHDARMLDEAAERGVAWLKTLHHEPEEGLPWSGKIRRMQDLQVQTLRAAIKGALHE